MCDDRTFCPAPNLQSYFCKYKICILLKWSDTHPNITIYTQTLSRKSRPSQFMNIYLVLDPAQKWRSQLQIKNMYNWLLEHAMQGFFFSEKPEACRVWRPLISPSTSLWYADASQVQKSESNTNDHLCFIIYKAEWERETSRLGGNEWVRRWSCSDNLG